MNLINKYIEHRYGKFSTVLLSFYKTANIGKIRITAEYRNITVDNNFIMTKTRMRIIKQWIERGLLERQETAGIDTDVPFVMYLRTDKKWQREDLNNIKEYFSPFKNDDLARGMCYFMQVYTGQW